MLKRLPFLMVLALLCAHLNAQPPGNALQFDGDSDYIQCNLPAAFKTLDTSAITLEAWIKPDTNTFSRIIYAQFDGTNYANFAFNSTYQIYFYVNANGTFASSKTLDSIPLHVWTHVACRWDPAVGNAEILINGIPAAVDPGGGSTTGTNNLMTIGARTNGAQFFPGEIDEVRIWEYARPDCAIQKTLNVELRGEIPYLVGYYPFNQGTPAGSNPSETTAFDSSSTLNHGTLIGFGLTSSTSNWITSTAPLSGYLPPNESLSHTGCPAIYTLNGITYTAYGTYYQTLLDTALCDSIIQFELISGSPDTTVSVAGDTLSSNNPSGPYQWLDCGADTLIPGATSYYFIPGSNGSYAVIVGDSSCTDTSTCVPVLITSIPQPIEKPEVNVFPNPTKDQLNLVWPNNPSSGTVELWDVLGNRIKVVKIDSGSRHMSLRIDDLTNGIYLLKIIQEGHQESRKILKQ